MRRKSLAGLVAALLLMVFTNTNLAAIRDADDDTETRIAQAKVVEVAEAHISVMARSGLEHVIAVDREGTKVTMDGRTVSLKDVCEGDVVTIELDAQKPVKFARNIEMRSNQSQVARVRR